MTIACLCVMFYYVVCYVIAKKMQLCAWEAINYHTPMIIIFASMSLIGVVVWSIGKFAPDALKVRFSQEVMSSEDFSVPRSVAKALVHMEQSDRGWAVCCGYNCFIFVLAMFGVSTYIVGMTYAFKTDGWFSLHHDHYWGFLLEEGHNYTGPVFVTEFGAQAYGNYWIQLLNYMGQRDIDWAYWVLNPRKKIQGLANDGPLSPGWYDYQGDEVYVETETYSILEEDWSSVRYPWMMQDLHHIMPSPPYGKIGSRPCRISVFGSDCGG